MGIECRCPQCFVDQCIRLIVRPPAAFFHNDPDLFLEIRVLKLQILHTVRFQLHHLLKICLRNLLKIGGVIRIGKGVVLSAQTGDDLGKAAVGIFFRSLEHHVFKHMGDARRSVRFIHRTDTIPDHMGDNRSPVIFPDNDFHTVVQDEFLSRFCLNAILYPE